MTYTKIFNAERYLPILKTVEDIQQLRAGESYDVEVKELHILRVRWLLYDWLAHMELGEKFKIRKLKGRLVVERIEEIEVRGGKVGKRERKIQQAVEVALQDSNPGRKIRELLSGKDLGEGLQQMVKELR